MLDPETKAYLCACGFYEFYCATHQAMSTLLDMGEAEVVKRCMWLLLDSLAWESPVAAYMPLTVVRNLLRVQQIAEAAGTCWVLDQKDLQVIGTDAPILSSFLESLVVVASKDSSSNAAPRIVALGSWQKLLVPPQVRPVLQRMLQVVCSTFDADRLPSGVGCMTCVEESEASCHSDACLHTGICSGLPKIRCIPEYSMPVEHQKKGKACTKAQWQAGQRTGGLFSFFCEHGICYSLFIMDRSEGRAEPFAFLSAYLKTPPRLVLYDFACALHEYILNRASVHFADTMCEVDKLHWCNHQSCSQAYNSSLYPQLRGANSQVAEQSNSTFERIKASVQQMEQRSFMWHMRMYASKRNVDKADVLRRQRDMLHALASCK